MENFKHEILKKYKVTLASKGKILSSVSVTAKDEYSAAWNGLNEIRPYFEEENDCNNTIEKLIQSYKDANCDFNVEEIK
jgi:hypothetical protein